MTGNIGTFTLFIQTIASLILVLGLIVLTIVFLRRFVYRRGSSSGSALVSVLSMTAIAPKKNIALIRVADRFLIVGVTESTMTFLTELTSPAAIASIQEETVFDASHAGIPFAQHLSKVWGRKKS